jgi:hypothetical protein
MFITENTGMGLCFEEVDGRSQEQERTQMQTFSVVVDRI